MSARAEHGQIITVFSLKGGVGTSTIAVNTAIAIKRAAPSARVGIIDLSLEDGHVALLLDIVPTSTIVDWAHEDLSGATPHMLNQYFVQHRTGIAALAAPPSPEQAEMVRPDSVRLTLELAIQAFDYVLIDTASTFSEITLCALDKAHTVLIPVTPDMAAVKSVVNTMRILKAVNVRLDKIKILQNEIVPRAGLTREQLEASLGKNLFVIPHAGASLIEASNQGKPIVTISPPTPTAKALSDLARTLCVPEVEETHAQKPGMGLFRERLEGRLGLKRA
jgi:pilus assembly protein CpaE